MSGVRSITKKQLSVLTTTISMSSINSSIILGLLGTYPYHTFAALFFSFVLFRRLNKGTDHNNPNGLPLAPGPKGYPLIGNLFDMPVDKPWVAYDKWRKTYGKILHQWLVITNTIQRLNISGDMIYLNVLGQHIVILSSPTVITDLFEKRSSNYSDRKQMTMLNELCVST